MTEATLIETGGFERWEPPVADRGDWQRAMSLLAELCGGIVSDARTVVIPGEPPSKGRPRATIRNGKIQTYTPAATRKAEKRLAWQMRPLGHHPSGPLAVALIFYRSSAHRVDIDNLQKAALDSATMAAVWSDDSQVKALASTLAVDRVHPRIVCAIAAIPTTQLEIGA